MFRLLVNVALSIMALVVVTETTGKHAARGVARRSRHYVAQHRIGGWTGYSPVFQRG